MLRLLSTTSLVLLFAYTSFAQNQHSETPHFVYTLRFTEDFTPGNGKSKVYVLNLRKLFKEQDVRYNHTQNAFFVTAVTQRKSLAEYTAILTEHGAILSEPIRVQAINLSTSSNLHDH